MSGDSMTRQGGDQQRRQPSDGAAPPRRRINSLRRGLGAFAFLATMLLGSARPAVAQEMPAPVSTQLSILLRVLAYDRNFEPNSPGEIVVGLLYQPNLRASNLAMTDMASAVTANGVGPTGEAVRTVPMPFGSSNQLQDALKRNGIDLLYVAPLRAVDLGDLAGACQAEEVLSATGVPDYVERGIAVGVGARGGRPTIMINLEVAKALGADFSSELLKLAEIIQAPAEPPRNTRTLK